MALIYDSLGKNLGNSSLWNIATRLYWLGYSLFYFEQKEICDLQFYLTDF